MIHRKIWRRGVMRHHGVALHLAARHGDSREPKKQVDAFYSLVTALIAQRAIRRRCNTLHPCDAR